MAAIRSKPFCKLLVFLLPSFQRVVTRHFAFRGHGAWKRSWPPLLRPDEEEKASDDRWRLLLHTWQSQREISALEVHWGPGRILSRSCQNRGWTGRSCQFERTQPRFRPDCSLHRKGKARDDRSNFNDRVDSADPLSVHQRVGRLGCGTIASAFNSEKRHSENSSEFETTRFRTKEILSARKLNLPPLKFVFHACYVNIRSCVRGSTEHRNLSALPERSVKVLLSC